jgi:hypothetical protein
MAGVAQHEWGCYMFFYGTLATFFIACAVGLVLNWVALKRVLAFISDPGAMWSEEL